MSVFCSIVYAQQADSTRMLIQADSILVYKVEKGDNYFAIARKYGITAKELMEFNEAKSSALRLGQILRIPIKKTVPISNIPAPKPDDISTTLTRLLNMTKSVVKNTNSDTVKKTPIGTYVVKKGDYLYSIARTYGITLQQLKEANHLRSNSLKIGQVLKIPGKSPSTVIPTVSSADADNDSVGEPVDHVDTDLMLRNRHRSVRSVKEIEESGVATWIKVESTSKGKCYALHKTAPIGTVIKVTNTMNNKSVYVKVVGTLQLNSESDNTIIKVSLTAAKTIGVINDKFQAHLVYALPKND